jgi:hypothetical protein
MCISFQKPNEHQQYNTTINMSYRPTTRAMSQFQIVQISNKHYQDYVQRHRRITRNNRVIMPLMDPDQSQCDHDLPTPCPPSTPMPTPCPPSTPIITQCTESGLQSFQALIDPNNNKTVSNNMNSIVKTHYEQDAIFLLNELNEFPVVESISPLLGSRADHAYYICRLCTPGQCEVSQWKKEPQSYTTRRTQPHGRNIGAIIKHLSDDHHPDQSNQRDKLSIEAFTHVGEIRHRLQKIKDRQAFMLVKSSSEALSTAMWKTNQETSHTMDRIYQHCLDQGICLNHAKMNTGHDSHVELDLANHSYCDCVTKIDTSTSRPITFVSEAKRSFLIVNPTLHRLPPIDRDGPIPQIPPPQLLIIPTKSTGLSLDQKIGSIPKGNTPVRMKYALQITGTVPPNNHRSESTEYGLTTLNEREPEQSIIPTPTPTTINTRPTTRQNGTTQGNWDRATQTFRRSRP